jgi:hypothetical protein
MQRNMSVIDVDAAERMFAAEVKWVVAVKQLRVAIGLWHSVTTQSEPCMYICTLSACCIHLRRRRRPTESSVFTI